MRLLPVIAIAGIFATGCATRGPLAPQEIADRIQQRTGATANLSGSAPGIPPGVTLEDGLTLEDAVAIALWNNADFQVQVTDLGFARADLLEAGLLHNPILSVLFPVGPKQLEARLRWPVEVLWERPRRIAAARASADRVAAVLEQNGLALATDVKVAYVDLALAEDRAHLASQAAAELEDISRITRSRLEAGDISALEARTSAIEAARARQDAVRARLDVALRANDLRARLGLALDRTDIVLAPWAAPTEPCGTLPTLLEEALASRPDVRAAELAIEAAGRRLGWERSRILALSAVLDGKGIGSQSFHTGPGFETSMPFFDRNQGGRARAAAELDRAARSYLATRHRVATELRDATTQFDQANTALTGWREMVLSPLEEQVRAAERAFEEGEASYLFVLEMNRRLTEARLKTREAEADLARARARTERAVGHRCGAEAREIVGEF